MCCHITDIKVCTSSCLYMFVSLFTRSGCIALLHILQRNRDIHPVLVNTSNPILSLAHVIFVVITCMCHNIISRHIIPHYLNFLAGISLLLPTARNLWILLTALLLQHAIGEDRNLISRF